MLNLTAKKKNCSNLQIVVDQEILIWGDEAVIGLTLLIQFEVTLLSVKNVRWHPVTIIYTT